VSPKDKRPDQVTWHVDADGVALVEMRDEKTQNALSEPFVQALAGAFESVVSNETAKVVVLAGTPEVFCSGAPKALLRRLVRGDVVPGDIRLPGLLLGVPLPTIAAMEGHAVGGGFAVGLCADVVIMARESRYGCNFMNMGLTPGMGTTRLLEYVLSPAIAHELLYTGELRRGADFLGYSGVNYVLPRRNVRSKALDLAARIAEKPRTALETLKRGLMTKRCQIFEETFALEREMHRATLAQPEIGRLIEEEFYE